MSEQDLDKIDEVISGIKGRMSNYKEAGFGVEELKKAVEKLEKAKDYIWEFDMAIEKHVKSFEKEEKKMYS